MNIKYVLIPAAVACLLFTAASPEKNKPSYTSRLEAEIFRLVNIKRVKKDIKPLKPVKKLIKIARAHSKDMAKRDYTSHETPDGLSPSERAKKAGFNIVKKKGRIIRKGIGENIYENYYALELNGVVKPKLQDVKETAKKAVDGWMNSPGHRKNILNSDYTITGVGAAVSKDKKVKITQVFF